jgi:outer membrane PBP1 activator LpoA protein
MAAYNDQGNNGYKPSIHFYDSEQATPLFLYSQAITGGAELIIGPLQKETIQSLADSVTLQVPVLALNHIPGLEKDNLYQFGLNPIDDVEEISRKAGLDGHRKAVLLVPDNAQGNRIAGYFASSWQDMGGSILETQTFKPKETDFSEPIKKLLNLDESEYRFNKILALIPSIKYTPRRRQDADALLLNANGVEARSINPQLHYYQASRLPVYATPGVYSGQANPSLDSDLDTITFCDTPWLLDKTYLGRLGMEALKDTWQTFSGSYLRLLAMGMDAYHLSAHLKSLDISPYHGATGTLSLVADNRIKRNLACARFSAGLPELTDPISATAESFENSVSGSDPEAATVPQPVQEQPLIDHVAE